MLNQDSTKTRVSRAKRSLFFQSNSSQKCSNSSHFSQTKDNSFILQTPKYQKPYSERRISIHPLDNRNNYERETNYYENDHWKSSPQNSRNQQSVPLKKEKQQKLKVIESKYDLSKIQIQNQMFIIKKLSLIDYCQEKFQILEKNFMNVIHEHIEIKNYQPNALTVMGANLIADGKYHELWIKMFDRNDKLSKMSLKRIKKQYYNNYKDAVKINYKNFQQSLKMKESPNIMDEYLRKSVVPQIEDEKKHEQPTLTQKENFNPDQEDHSQKKFISEQKPFQNNQSNQVQNQITAINVPSSNKNGDQPETQSEVDIVVSEEQKDSKPMPINQALLKYRQINQRRVAAEMVCKFFNITSERTFSLTQIKIEEVLQVNQQPKSEYAILIGRKIVKKSNKKKVKVQNQHRRSSQRIQTNEYVQITQGGDKCFISCYKYMNLEQLIRLQMTYGKIYGFIAYDKQVDFFQFLQLNQGKNRLSLTYKVDSDDQSPQQNPKRNKVAQTSKRVQEVRNKTKNTEKTQRNIYKRKRNT